MPTSGRQKNMKKKFAPVHKYLASPTCIANAAAAPFLPMTLAEMNALGWDELDILFITGDAYVDHPAFGVALLGRWLMAHGFKVGICAQPRWQDTEDIMAMGRPRYFVGVTAGALDSQLAHYTAFRKKRHDDAYTPGGQAGARPNRASVVYTNLARRAFPGVPVILGGIEASLRRISHYDFWSDSLRRSILLDAKAHYIVYGMGERAILEMATRCRDGEPLTHVHGSVWMGKPQDIAAEDIHVHLPSYEAIQEDASLLMDATLQLEAHVHNATGYAIQMYDKRALIMAPPAQKLSEAEMDMLYSLPFQRAAHPTYTLPIPAVEMLRTSITSHRGCGGGCSFCSLALHQGRRLSSRSAHSILQEAQRMTEQKKFSGSISDVGGPTANMWQGSCTNPKECKRSSCCHPKVCSFFVTPQKAHVELLRKIRSLDGIRHVRVASGIRADIAMHEPDAVLAYTTEFTGGQLKIAPEHCVAEVLDHMRKPPLQVFEVFLQAFQKHSGAAQREQYVVPYLMSAFPGCTDAHMHALAAWLQERHWKPQQVQCFIPTPGTIATAMYYTGLDTNKEPIFVARSDAQRLRQHGILMPNLRKNTAVNKKNTSQEREVCHSNTKQKKHTKGKKHG